MERRYPYLLWLVVLLAATHPAVSGDGSQDLRVKIRTGENLTSPAATDSLVEILSAHNVREVFLLMKSDEETPELPSGLLFYPGTTAPVAPGFTEDLVGRFINRSHEKGIRVLAWLPVFKDAMFWQQNPQARAYILTENGTRIEQPNWLTPFAPQAVTHTRAIVSEIVQRYRVDGFVFDYIRFDSDFGSVDDWALRSFEERFGKALKIETLRDEARKHSRTWKKWTKLRAERVAEAVGSLVAHTRSLRPNLRIGITVLPFSARGYNRNTVSGQDYKLLSQTGVDFLSPLGYWDDWLKSPEWVAETFKGALDQVEGRCEVIISIDGDMSFRNTVATWAVLPVDHNPVFFYYGRWSSDRLAMLQNARQGALPEIPQLVTIRIDTEPDDQERWDVPVADFYRILDLFDELQIRATWITAGRFAETRPEIVRELYSRGHEVALHGWAHERFEDLPDRDEKLRRITAGLSAMSKLGIPIFGFGAPQNSIDRETLDILLSLGFSYDASLALDPLQGQWPSIRYHTNSDGTLPVIPYIYPNDYDLIVVKGMEADEVFQQWKDRLDFSYNSGRSPFVVDVHQWLIGQPEYLEALRKFVLYAKEMKDVQFATLYEVVQRREGSREAVGQPSFSESGDSIWMWLWQGLLRFLGYFPAILALQYIAFSLLFRAAMEGKEDVDATFEPSVSVLVPAHNEATNIRRTLEAIMASDYGNFDVTVIDDGSTDGTASVAAQVEGVRVLRLEANRGKAHGLNRALAQTSGEIVVCIDADTVVEKETLRYLIQKLKDPEIAGVTGNPQIRSRKGFLRKLQTMEYATIISVIKRAEALLGGLYTVSGAICAFRRSVLDRAGGWNEITQTEDIDVSWRLQKLGYRITYEPRAICWISVPGSYRALFRQRVRWSRGSGEAYRNHLRILKSSNTASIPIVLNGVVSAAWTVSLLAVVPLVVAGVLPGNEDSLRTLIAGGILLHMQSAVGLSLDRRYNPSLPLFIAMTPFFIIYFWLLVFPSFIHGFLKGLLGEENGIWVIERA
jgi:biofilm PGA synthesis N-glycosyltransferase PgaC